MKYFPFTGIFDLKMGTSLMKEGDSVVEIDEHYQPQISLKRDLLLSDHPYYFKSQVTDFSAEWEAVEKIIKDLVRVCPENFYTGDEGSQSTFTNGLLGEQQSFTFGDDLSITLSPLDWIGRHVQEDLIILNAKGDIVAGQLCFPSGWSLQEKIGKQFLEVHAPLPTLMNPMIESANKLIERLPVNKPVARNNWGFRLGDQLDLSTKNSRAYKQRLSDAVPNLSLDTIGDEIFLRVEHQTLSRLPRSGCILFTIHTYNSLLKTEASDSDKKLRMLQFLKTTPSDLIAYKQMETFYKLLIRYLEV